MIDYGIYHSNLCFDDINKLPIYWINLDVSHERRSFFVEQAHRLGLQNHRINAVTSNMTLSANIEMSSKSRLHNEKEFYCLASHFLAIQTAVKMSHLYEQPFAIIMEDDVQIEFGIDFVELINSAPKDFGILQIMTSNLNNIENAYELYKAEKVES
jgi:GR25 family glycosyltransferase involved in LPS biosynthesis